MIILRQIERMTSPMGTGEFKICSYNTCMRCIHFQMNYSYIDAYFLRKLFGKVSAVTTIKSYIYSLRLIREAFHFLTLSGNNFQFEKKIN